MPHFLKSLILGVLAAQALAASSAPKAKADESHVAAVVSATTTGWVVVVLAIQLGFSSQSVEEKIVVTPQGLLDQAYGGAGDAIEKLAKATGKSTEEVADTIVTLDLDGKLPVGKPAVMAEQISLALAVN